MRSRRQRHRHGRRGLGCRLIVEKTDLSDSSVAASIVDATNKGAHAINMSFGTEGTEPAAKPIVDAINYAYAHNVVLVAAAADAPVTEQGDPSNVLQPSNTGPNITQGIGLDVTAADFAGHRAPFAGHGTQISIAAYGAYGAQTAARPGCSARSRRRRRCSTPAAPDRRPSPRATAAPVRRRPALRLPSGHVDGRAAGRRGGRARALVQPRHERRRHDQPAQADGDATGRGRLDRRPGLGHPQRRGGPEQAKSIDRTPPASKLTVSKPTSTTVTLRWNGSDVPPPGVVSTGVAKFEVYRSINGAQARRFLTTTQHSTKVKLQRGKKYTFYTLAIDNGGNRELAPKHPDATLRLRVLHTVRSKSRHGRR